MIELCPLTTHHSMTDEPSVGSTLTQVNRHENRLPWPGVLSHNMSAFAGIFGSLGAAVGLIIGLLANPATAWFAIFELGLPAAVIGGLLGLLIGLLTLLLRRG